MKRYLLLFAVSFCFCLAGLAQSLERTVRQRLETFFGNYETLYAEIGRCGLESFELDNEKKTLKVYANAAFGYQPFTEENTSAIYRSLKQVLPGPVNYYSLQVFADGQPIENLVPNAFRRL